MRNLKKAAEIAEKTDGFMECGSCGEWHPFEFPTYSDCRDDNNRFSFDEIPGGKDLIFLCDLEEWGVGYDEAIDYFKKLKPLRNDETPNN